ncbi:sensor histidine kinase [Halobellus rufus]|uniref:sensor histidine kinase n=1 Tax=Halobellus rufus TaxID=1448860 RepID=UPI0009DF265E|nr:HAMP domain-containing sensor histidine kinase [Halobellus rufus]
MTDEHNEALTVDEFPDPIVVYTVDDDVPRITALNEAFASAFDEISSGMPVATIFEQFSVVNSTGRERPITHLSQGDCVGIYLDGTNEEGPFFARMVSADENSGYLAFIDLSKCPDVAESPAIDQVSSVISHDLRNPLDVAKAHLRAARETGDAEHFDAVTDAHNRMEQIIRDVLTITQDQTAVDPSDNVSIEAAAKGAWQSVDTENATLNIRGTLPIATADADRLQRLFENLFRNAIEHSLDVNNRVRKQKQEPNSEREVIVSVGALDEGFYIADDGQGIPSEEQNRVFDPGFSTRDGGTGLGLAIVDRIVAAHSWELTLTTATNGGARFEIRF